MTQQSNEKALAILGQQYNSFINLTDHWDFFRGLADYTKTVQLMTQTRPFIEGLEKQQAATQKMLEHLNSRAFKEMFKSAEQLTAISQKLAKQYEPMVKVAQDIAEKYAPVVRTMDEMAKRYEPVFKAMIELSERVNGLTVSDRPLHSLERNLFDVAHNMRQSGNAEAVKEFEHQEKKGDYTFSPTYEKLKVEEEKAKRQEEVEPYGAWYQLPFAKEMVYAPDTVIKQAKADVKAGKVSEITLLNLFGIAHEIEQIRKGAIADDDVVFFKIKDFKNYAQRVHTFFTTQLLQAPEVIPSELKFDTKNSVLYFAGKAITISQRAQSDAHDLLRTLFKDPTKQWHTDEILDDWQFDIGGKIPKNKAYQAGKSVNRIVASKTQIEDFLIVTTKIIDINKQYLDK